jgi:protein O-mannosyl-transferase
MNLTFRQCVLIIFFVGLSVYFNALQNGFIVGDDEDQIINHPLVHQVSNIPAIFSGSTYYEPGNQSQWGPFYRPLMLTCFSLIYSFVGPDPLFFHLFQILLHLTNTVLLLYLFNYFTKRLDISLFTALIFLVHPIQSEAVLHAANLQEVLFFLCGISAIIYCIKKPLDTWIQLIVFGMLQLLSLFAKETAVLFIAICLLYAHLYKKAARVRIGVASLTSLALYAYFRFFLAEVSGSQPAIGQITSLSTAMRLAHVPIIVGQYLKNVLFPFKQAVFQMWIIPQIHPSDYVVPGLLIVSSLLFLLVSYQKVSGSNNRKRALLIFSAWFLLGLILHSQLFPLYVTYADRWFYFTFAGLLGCFTLALAAWYSKSLPRWLMAVFGMSLVLLSVQTSKRTFDFRITASLLEADLTKAPQPYYLQNLLATEYLRNGNTEAAQPLIDQSLATYPFMGNVSNKAIVELNLGKHETAKEYFIKALEYGDNYQIYRNLVNFLVLVDHDYQLARQYALEALIRYPQSSDLHLMLAVALFETGEPEPALKHATTAHELYQSKLTRYVLDTIKESAILNLDPYLEIN